MFSVYSIKSCRLVNALYKGQPRGQWWLPTQLNPSAYTTLSWRWYHTVNTSHQQSPKISTCSLRYLPVHSDGPVKKSSCDWGERVIFNKNSDQPMCLILLSYRYTICFFSLYPFLVYDIFTFSTRLTDSKTHHHLTVSSWLVFYLHRP